jgi:hypothetical protein
MAQRQPNKDTVIRRTLDPAELISEVVAGRQREALTAVPGVLMGSKNCAVTMRVVCQSVSLMHPSTYCQPSRPVEEECNRVLLLLFARRQDLLGKEAEKMLLREAAASECLLAGLMPDSTDVDSGESTLLSVTMSQVSKLRGPHWKPVLEQAVCRPNISAARVLWVPVVRAWAPKEWDALVLSALGSDSRPDEIRAHAQALLVAAQEQLQREAASLIACFEAAGKLSQTLVSGVARGERGEDPLAPAIAVKQALDDLEGIVFCNNNRVFVVVPPASCPGLRLVLSAV